MDHKVFFSFHYERDVLRIGQIRNSGLTMPDDGSVGFIDAAEWESIERRGDNAVEAWIDSQLEGTTVTVVLIGSETASRRWVLHEIKRSHEKGNALLGIYIHNVKDLNQQTDRKGENPFLKCGLNEVPVYDWVDNDGYNNFSTWLNRAKNRSKVGKVIGAGAGAIAGAALGPLGVISG